VNATARDASEYRRRTKASASASEASPLLFANCAFLDAVRERWFANAGRRCRPVPVRVAERASADPDGTLRSGVREFSPRLGESIELLVERAQVGADDAPIKLLSERRALCQLDHRRV
jgi:hypothetical protein